MKVNVELKLRDTGAQADNRIEATVSSRVLWRAQTIANEFFAVMPDVGDDMAPRQSAQEIRLAEFSHLVAKVFRTIDTDNNGHLDLSEIRQATHTLYGKNMTLRELETGATQLLKNLDVDQGGTVTLDELLDYFLKSRATDTGVWRGMEPKAFL